MDILLKPGSRGPHQVRYRISSRRCYQQRIRLRSRVHRLYIYIYTYIYISYFLPPQWKLLRNHLILNIRITYWSSRVGEFRNPLDNQSNQSDNSISSRPSKVKSIGPIFQGPVKSLDHLVIHKSSRIDFKTGIRLDRRTLLKLKDIQHLKESIFTLVDTRQLRRLD